jgi:hypothetical protein
MRFFDSPNFPRYVASAIALPTMLLVYLGQLSGAPLVALVTLCVLIALDGFIWERIFGFDGPMAEDILLHSFKWASRRYAAALILSCSAGMILYVYGADDWRSVPALVGPSVIYTGLLVFDIIRAMHVVDERVTGKSRSSDKDHCG